MRFLLLLLVALSAQAQQLPDPSLTPGACRPLSVQQLCSTKWGHDARHVTPKMKREVCDSYHAHNCPKVKVWEIDHLISRELGGEDVSQNLWPQPAPDFHWKDRLENKLHREVCAGRLSLADAQMCIGRDWVGCYQKHVGPLPPR